MADHKPIDLNSLDFSGVHDIDKLDFSGLNELPLEGANEPGMLESGLRGAAQGASFGTADEITGALEAAKDVAVDPNQKLKDYMDLYRRHRDESRANYKAAEEANPITSTVGNLAGGLATGLVAAPLAAAGEAATTIKGAAKIGALAGGAAGLGSSEADLTRGEVGQAAKDVAEGAGAGALGGAVLQGAGNSLKSFAKFLKNTKPGEMLASAANPEIDLSHAGRKAFKEETRNYVEEKGQALSDLLKKIGGEKEELLIGARQAGIEVDNHDILQATKKDLEDLILTDPEQLKDKDRAIAALNNALHGKIDDQGRELIPVLDKVDPVLADKYRKSVGQMANMGERSIATGEVQAPINRLMGELSQSIEEAVPGYEAVQGKYSGAKGAMQALGLEDLNPKDPQYAQKLYTALSQAGKSSESAEQAAIRFKPFIENLRKASPELADELEKEFVTRGKTLELGRVAGREGFPGHEMGVASSFAASGKAQALQGVNRVARMISDAKQAPRNLPLLGAALDTKFGQAAAGIVKQLQNAAAAEAPKRNAIVFSLMQNPDFRQMVDTLEPDALRPKHYLGEE